jgi:hypothetical protein
VKKNNRNVCSAANALMVYAQYLSLSIFCPTPSLSVYTHLVILSPFLLLIHTVRGRGFLHYHLILISKEGNL